MTTPDAKLVALITGCADPGSIGASLARDLNKRGYKVFATARKLETLQHLQETGCEVLALDVTDKLSIAAAKTRLEEEGRLDVLVNNAGVEDRVPVLDADLDTIRAMYEVNVFAPIAMAQAFAPLLVEGHRVSGRQSVMVNIGSQASWGVPWLGMYGSTKAALHAASDALRRELAPLGIAAITVELGVVSTAMSRGEKKFGLLSATPSGFYPNFSEIEARFTDDFKKRGAGAPDVQSVARSLGNAIAASTPPRKLWLGADSFLFRWIAPFLPVSILDSLMGKAQHVNLVQRQ